MKAFIRCTRGLEWIAAAEAAERLSARDLHVAHRTVQVDTAEPIAGWRELGSVDDVGVLIGELRAGPTRPDLPEVIRQAKGLPRPPEDAMPSGAGSTRSFSVSASMRGRRSYHRVDLEDAVGRGLAEAWRATYASRRGHQRPPAPTVVRVHADGDRAHVAVRVGSAPLHRRAYKIASRTGTLHPPVAHAMALIAGVAPGDVLYDPFCGVGTIPIEAARACPGLIARGSDLDATVVADARRHAPAAAPQIAFEVADAARLALEDGSVDRLVANPPWGRRVPAQGSLASGAAPFWREARRVLAPGGRMVLLLAPADLEREGPALAAEGFHVALELPLRVSGALAALVGLAPEDDGKGWTWREGAALGRHLGGAWERWANGGV